MRKNNEDGGWKKMKSEKVVLKGGGGGWMKRWMRKKKRWKVEQKELSGGKKMRKGRVGWGKEGDEERMKNKKE